MTDEKIRKTGDPDLAQDNPKAAELRKRKLIREEILNAPDKIKKLRAPGWDEIKPVGKEW